MRSIWEATPPVMLSPHPEEAPMPVQFTKPQPNPATAERVAEVMQAVDAAVRSVAPAVQRAGEDMARALRSVRRPT
jgi:hypothetical protein